MPEYQYSIYAQDGSVTAGQRNTKFTLQELQSIIGGRIDILPAKIPGVKGFNNVYVVSEDGMYRYKPNAAFPNFYGPVLFTDKKSVR